MEIKELQPNLVFRYFNDILQIPRPSKKEEKIIAYLKNFAEQHHLDYKIDKVGNVVIRKPAAKGYENKKTVVLQSHIDMVCEKNSDVQHDFEKDPIPAYVDGDWIKTKGTTLGADDGIGVAAALAVLADDSIEHGPIECLFTMDEETGMTGAENLQEGFIKGDILINLDSEDEGELFMGCAGGMDTEARFVYNKEEVKKGSYTAKIIVSGLKGGHSGDDIDKKLGNSIKILVRLLRKLDSLIKGGIQISEIDGGNLRNAIPREAYAIVSIANQHNKELMRQTMNRFWADVEAEFIQTEPNIRIDLESMETPEYAIDADTKNRLLLALQGVHHGVFAMSQAIEGLVETSSNLASVKMLADNVIEVATSQRSSIESAKENIVETVASVFKLAGAEVEQKGNYPGWEPNINSPILKITQASYNKLFNTHPKVRAIHAGLECGLFLTKFPKLDMVSFGPTIRGAHSPEERLDIPSVQKFWDLLLDVLKKVPEK